MIYNIMRETAAILQTRKVPFDLFYGPETKPPTTITRPRAVFLRPPRADRAAFNDSAGQLMRSLRFDVLVFVQSTIAGSNKWNHERVADQFVDQLMRAVRQVCTLRIQPCRPAGSWGLLDEKELELLDLKTWPGAVYGLGFEVDRGVKEENWLGEEAATVAFADPNDPDAEGVRISSTTQVNLNGSAGPAETGCGG